MKKILFYIFSVVLFFFFVLFDSTVADAVQYSYSGGVSKDVYDDVEVLSFDYDYMSKFVEQDGYYKGHQIFDNGVSLKDELFYTAPNMEIKVNHVDKLWVFTKDDDRVEIRRYSENKQSFSSIIASFDNQSGSYTLDKEGVYKVVYIFEEQVVYFRYVYITSGMHTFKIIANEMYNKVSAYYKFSFKLSLADAYDLRKNSYYYAFGEDENNLRYSRFDVFSSDEKNSSKPIYSVDEKEFQVDILDEDECLSGEKKYLYVKAVKDIDGKNFEEVVSTKKTYSLSRKLEAALFLLDEQGNEIEGEKFYKKDDVIYAELRFNSPVKFSGLEASLNGVDFINLSNADENVSFVKFSYLVKDTIDTTGIPILRTINNQDNQAIVNCGGVNVPVFVKKTVNYGIDVTNPGVSIVGDSPENIQRSFDVLIDVKDANLFEIKYYLDKCRITQSDKCMDQFDGGNSNVNVLDQTLIQQSIATNTVKINVSIDGELVGVSNGEKLVVFVRAEDKAGNVNYGKTYGYQIDNVIVEEDFESMVKEENIENGKRLLIQVKEEYKISLVRYRYGEGEEYNACTIEDEVERIYDCVSVQGHYFSSIIQIELRDLYGNIEFYDWAFKYNDLVPSVVQSGEYTINIYNDKDYDAEIFGVSNFMGIDEKRLSLGVNLNDTINNELNLNVSDLSKRLVYLDTDELIVLVEDLDDNLTMPSLMEILEKINVDDKYSMCALKGQQCAFSVYIQYAYYIEEVLQNRFVRINFIDDTVKLDVSDFENSMEIEVFGVFTPLSYVAFDGLNVKIDVTEDNKKRSVLFIGPDGESYFVNGVDNTKIGVYKITEQVVCSSGVSYPLFYEVVVKDSKAPVVVLKGVEEIAFAIGGKIPDFLEGVEVRDEYDNNLEILYEIEEGFDINKAGKYQIKYWSVDSSGNVSNIVTRTLIVKQENELQTYLIVGGIAFAVILIMTVTIIFEVKKERRRT